MFILANFWTSTIHDNDLLPCIVPIINNDDKAFSLQKDKHLEEQNLSHTIDSTSSWNHTEILNSNSNFLISYVIDYKVSVLHHLNQYDYIQINFIPFLVNLKCSAK